MNDPVAQIHQEDAQQPEGKSVLFLKSHQIALVKKALWHCLNSKQLSNANEMVEQWRNSYRSKPLDTVIRLLQVQARLLEKKKIRQFKGILAPLAAICCIFLEWGEMSRSFFSALEVADIVTAKGDFLLGEELTGTMLQLIPSFPQSLVKRIIPHAVSVMIIWLLAVPLSFANFSSTKQTLQRIMKLYSAPLRRRIRATDGYRISKIWLKAIKQNDQMILQQLENIQVQHPEDSIYTLSERLVEWKNHYLLIHEAIALLKLI